MYSCIYYSIPALLYIPAPAVKQASKQAMAGDCTLLKFAFFHPNFIGFSWGIKCFCCFVATTQYNAFALSFVCLKRSKQAGGQAGKQADDILVVIEKLLRLMHALLLLSFQTLQLNQSSCK